MVSSYEDVAHFINWSLPGKPVEFKQFISAHDSWLFNFPENLKLHNQVCKFEQAQATEVERRFIQLNTRVETHDLTWPR